MKPKLHVLCAALVSVVSPALSADPLADAVDFGSLTFDSGGDAPWFRGKTSTFDGVDSAASGAISDGETSWMETTVTGPAEVSFHYRVSTQSGAAYFRLNINGITQMNRAGETGWLRFSKALGAGSHTIRWIYRKTGPVSTGGDRVWVDRFQVLSKLELLGARAHASDWIFGHGPEEAFDGIVNGIDSDGGNFWAGYGFSSYLTVPLAYPSRVEQVRIAFEEGDTFWYGIAVDVSPYGYTQRRVLDPVYSSGTTEGFEKFDLADGGTSRFLTIRGFGTYFDDWNTYREVEAWGRVAPPITLSEALDNALLSFENGVVPWEGQDDYSFDGRDSAWSAAISHNGRTTFSTTLRGPGRLSFDVCVSSEAHYDFFRLKLDGADVISLSGEVPWNRRTVNIPSGEHTVTWSYEKDDIDLAPVGADAVWIDRVVYRPDSIPLREALDNTGLTFSAANWEGQPLISGDGIDAAQSGTTRAGSSTDLSTTVTGPGILHFSWKVSSEPDFDFLKLLVGGVLTRSISGEVDWTDVTVAVPEGSQTIRWRYQKDRNVSRGADAGFVDQVSYTRVDTTPEVTQAGSGFVVITPAPGALTTEFHISAGSSFGQVYLRDGTEVPVETGDIFRVTSAQAAEGLILFRGTAPRAEFVISAAEGPSYSIAFAPRQPESATFPGEFRLIDGSGNNPFFPERGKAGIPLLRSAPAAYTDGASAPSGASRPNPRVISNISCVAQGDATRPNSGRITDLFWQWGQFLDHDIDLTPEAEPHESFPISVPSGDPYFDPFNAGNITIPLSRSVYEIVDGVREQLNQITAFIDGSNVYGSDRETLDSLKAADFTTTGRLLVSAGELLPLGPSSRGGQEFKAGDVRAVEQIGLTAMHTLFVLEHNWWADRIRAETPGLGGEEIFQRARAVVAAEMQRITYGEFLPILLGPDALPPYDGYDPLADPGIVNEFSTAAYRFGHTMLSPRLLRLQSDGHPISAGHAALRDAFFQPPEVLQNNGGIEPLILGLSSQIAQEIDNLLIDDVRNFLFGPPGPATPPDRRGFDLAALNIQRGRDHGLPGFNVLRAAYGLPPVTSWDQITSDPERCVCLSMAYNGNLDQVDPWVGCLAEDHYPGARIGSTGRAIIADQFRRLRDGDRFWYQSYFTGALLREIEETTLADIIARNTNLPSALVRENGFLRPRSRIVHFRAGLSGVDLRFETFPGSQYRIEFSPGMTPGSWTPAMDALFGSGDVVDRQIPVSPDQERGFYRLAEEPLP